MNTAAPDRRRSMCIALSVVLLLVAACSDDDDRSTDGTADTTTSTAPIGDAVDMSALEVTKLTDEGGGVPATSATAGLEEAGYAESEFLVSGVTNLYDGPTVGPAEVKTENVPYTTRVLVRAPTDPSKFSGRVLLEPFNTSVGRELDAGWGFLSDAVTDAGDAWVGVTERVSAVDALKEFDAQRYRPLALRSNGQAWDILTQLGALLAEGGARSPLPDFDAEHLYMTGYSQSGVEISTYASAIHPLANEPHGSSVYDGYLVMGRAASMTTLDSGKAALPPFEQRPMGPVDVPVVELLTESDVQGFSVPAYTNPGGATVRRDDADADDDHYRLYEIPGAAHAPSIPGCDGGGTTFPNNWFIRAAYANLLAWTEAGTIPPTADRIETDKIDVVSEFARDEYGNARGGVRSPYLDVPISSYAGTDTPGPLCGLAGVETPLDDATLQSLYDDADDYLAQFEASLDATVAARFLLEGDTEAILTDARADAAERF
jgi:hypothetical protein